MWLRKAVHKQHVPNSALPGKQTGAMKCPRCLYNGCKWTLPRPGTSRQHGKQKTMNFNITPGRSHSWCSVECKVKEIVCGQGFPVQVLPSMPLIILLLSYYILQEKQTPTKTEPHWSRASVSWELLSMSLPSFPQAFPPAAFCWRWYTGITILSVCADALTDCLRNTLKCKNIWKFHLVPHGHREKKKMWLFQGFSAECGKSLRSWPKTVGATSTQPSSWNTSPWEYTQSWGPMLVAKEPVFRKQALGNPA